MNIDERLDALTARHEALAQSLELLAHIQTDAEKRHEEVWAKNEARWVQASAMFTQTTTLITQVAESVASLTQVAHLHERRISDLEEGKN